MLVRAAFCSQKEEAPQALPSPGDKEQGFLNQCPQPLPRSWQPGGPMDKKFPWGMDVSPPSVTSLAPSCSGG